MQAIFHRHSFAFFLVCKAILCLTACSSAWGLADEAASPVSPIDALVHEYQQKLDELDDLDATGHYELGFSYYKKYKPTESTTLNLKYLSIAKTEVKTTAGIFQIAIPDGDSFVFNTTDTESDKWAQIVKAFGGPLSKSYDQYHLKEELAAKKAHKELPPRKELTDLNADERMALLNDLAESDSVGHTHQHAKRMYATISAEYKNAQETMNPSLWEMAFMVIGGLGIFLYGMKHMSEGVQAVAGTRLRSMITSVTDNRFLAVGVGTGVTCIVQSSSITTVIVVGLVNSGIMALHQAIGVVMGANIGTTITGWILVLKVGKYGLLMLGVSVFVYLFSRTDRWRYIAMAVLGLGMVFFGLELMKNGFKPMRGMEDFVTAFKWFDAHTYFGVLKCAMVGCMLTFLVQSSSATLGITIGLASTGAIEFETAAALVLGENIGTTITAWLASIGATTNAKRTAYAHVMFNVMGVAWITALFTPYIQLIQRFTEWVHGYNPVGLTLDMVDGNEVLYGVVITFAIAATHTGFNVANTLIFLPFVRVFARFLERFVPDKAIKETPHLSPLDIRYIESPVMGIEASRGEIIKLGLGVQKMLEWTRSLIQDSKPDEQLVQKVFNREKIMDNVQAEIITFLTDLLTGNVPHAIVGEGRTQLRCADEYESISDYISSLLKSHLRMINSDLSLTKEEMDAVLELHEQVAEYLHMVAMAFENAQPDLLNVAHTRGDSITATFKQLRERHMSRLIDDRIDPTKAMAFTGMLNAYRKIKDHAENIAEAIATEHGLV